ncbi:MAG: LacI family DNA-binding transcriptional regulator [Micropruina sp.]|uniref:LacI family DNA-binding transcriptional regulator n=1 Tax=Micropruina sp. TaxID=2737536 RepID=UPI0039E682E5
MTPAPTLTEVAQRAGVSVSTASRAFSSPERIGSQTLARVIAVAEDMGYRASTPTRKGAGLAAGTVAVVVPDIGNLVFAAFVRAAQAQGWHRRQMVLVADTGGSPDQEREVITELLDRVGSLVVCSPRLPASEIAELASGTPVVLVNRASTECHCVLADSETGLRQAVDYLGALNHRHFAYVQGSPQSWSNERRVAAIQQLCEDRGIRLSLLGWQEESLAGGYAAAASVIATDATAVIAHNDAVAIGVMNGVRAMGVSVPDELSVIGIDDSPLARCASPALTSISVPIAQAGVLSMDLLFRPTSRTRRIEEHLPTQLVVRDSSGVAPTRATPAAGSDDQ